MESDSPDDRPESPKKKIRPSSTTSSETANSDISDTTDSVLPSNHSSEMNGVSPVRRGREAEARRNDISNLVKEQASIQEEVVSSSESTVQGRRQLTYSDGDADSLTNDTEDPNICEAASAVSSQSSEAERKEL